MDETKHPERPECCEDCIFWIRNTNVYGEGVCKRFPANHRKLFDDWCGEYKRAKRAKPLTIVDAPSPTKKEEKQYDANMFGQLPKYDSFCQLFHYSNSIGEVISKSISIIDGKESESSFTYLGLGAGGIMAKVAQFLQSLPPSDVYGVSHLIDSTEGYYVYVYYRMERKDG